MKKLLWFLLLFGGGLALILSIERGDAGADEDVGPPAELPVADQGARAAGDERPAFQSEGPLTIKQFADVDSDLRPLLLELEAAGIRDLDDERLGVSDVTAVVYDEETQQPFARVEAESGHVEMSSGETFDIEIGKRFVLESVVVRIVDDDRYLPVVLEVPTLEGEIVDGHVHLWSEALARVRSRGDDGFSAEGEGLRFAAETGTLELLRDPHVRVEPVEGRGVEISSAGKLSLRRPRGEPGSPVELRTERGSSLTVHGADEIALSSEELVLRARVEAEADGGARGLVLESIDATGNVAVKALRGDFLAERARMRFTPEGVLTQAVLSGRPHAWVELGELTAAPSASPEDDRRVTISGASEILLGNDGGPYFEATGPVGLEWEDARLSAKGGVRGSTDAPGGAATFAAWEGVVLRRGEFLLRGESLEAEYASGGPDAPIELRVRSNERVNLSGRTSEGVEFRLRTRERLEFVQVGEHWEVPLAEGVELETTGPTGFIASAERVENLEATRPSFVATGDVELHRGLETARGERLFVDGPDRVVIEGTTETPATYDSPVAHAEALYVERTGARMLARGSVKARWIEGRERYDISSETMALIRRPSVHDDVLSISFEIEAEGKVESHVELLRGDLELACDRLRGTRTERRALEPGEASREGFDPGDPALAERPLLEASTTLDAWGDVDGRFAQSGGVYELECEEVEAHATETGPEGRPEGELLARGGVRLVRSGGGEPVYQARGDRIRIDHAGTGVLLAKDGSHVWASGEMRGTGLPLEMTAERLEFSERLLEATAPEVRLLTTPTGRAAAAKFQLAASTVRALRLLATGTELLFSGQVAFQGTTGKGERWVLESGYARLENPDEEATGTAAIYRRIHAGDGFRFRIGDQLEAEGKDLYAHTRSGVLRLEGDPVTLSFYEMLFENEWIEFDLVTYLPRTGTGVLSNAPSTAEPR